MKRTGIAGLLFLSLAVPSAHADVTVRVEGEASTLLSRTSVAQTAGAEPNTGCPGDSAAAALERATNGNWDREAFAQTILGETHQGDDSDYWTVWVFRNGGFKVGNGLCTETLAAGEELLLANQVYGGPPDYAPTFFPLWVTGVPATVTAGQPFTVTVNKPACETAFCNPGEGTRVAGAGATVTAGDVTATADADGKATLTLDTTGPTSVRATAAGGTRSAAEAVTVTAPPVYQIPPGPAGSATPEPTVAPDTAAPFSTIRGIKEQQVFRKRRRAPRTLRATVTDDGSLGAVALSITRKHGKKCTAFNDTRGRFVRVKCGRHPRFGVGTDKTVSFLLPQRLGPGRYVFDVVATDSVGNQEQLARGRNRVVFQVK